MNTISPARAFRDGTIEAVRSFLDRSDSAAGFLADVDELLSDPDRSLPMPGLPIEPTPLKFERGTGVDIDNGPSVYDYLGAMDPSNASDPRLWCYLAFATYRPYMEARWPLDGARWKQRVESRWLIENSTRGRLVRHGIARLWWVSNLTYDATCQYPLSSASRDPFAYTRAVLGNEDRINALFDREAGAVLPASRAVLEHAAKSPEFAKDDHVRAVMKSLTLVYGYRDLAAMDDQSIRTLIEEVRPRAAVDS